MKNNLCTNKRVCYITPDNRQACYMIINDAEILFKRIKDVALRNPHRSEEFKKFVKRNFPEGDFHHALGSLGALKSSDLLGIVTDRETHMKGELNRDWIIAQLPQAIDNLMQYAIHLENKLKEKKGCSSKATRSV